ncbi:MAG: hypothetical protein COY58_08795 [Gammaproteobacteria bacterium CG_4_10_14_0_8_um_filter_38_16]|nr:MAG: hypothetical protein COY58_08795 [Gammaproteobacteria bacterium CG_4_10_14_0_8_um_filter_38_16]PJA02923.1 MAG: hypothetical protein COX72_07820 [Gammaproteobacteria bacterium CG_4_10_14_0_2_um_filter_38_22]PJB11410.1 MAG: hypothetical protein CO120_00420 [Gammaproteobacteria bacterium CG_4_9_14_3_um_filter_38_9]
MPSNKSDIATWLVCAGTRSIVSYSASTTTSFFLNSLASPTISALSVTTGVLAGATYDVVFWGISSAASGVFFLFSHAKKNILTSSPANENIIMPNDV